HATRHHRRSSLGLVQAARLYRQGCHSPTRIRRHRGPGLEAAFSPRVTARETPPRGTVISFRLSLPASTPSKSFRRKLAVTLETVGTSGRLKIERKYQPSPRTHEVSMPEKPLVMVFSNRKGGCGKTSSTFHIAGEFARRKLRVLLLDCDPQGSLSQSF